MRDYSRVLRTILGTAVLITVPCIAAGQSAEELAKATQNPVASLISVPFQGNWEMGLGDRDATSTLLNIQPVMPFGVTEDANLILRVILPVVSLPGSGGGERINGLGDIVLSAFFSPSKVGSIIWGVGPVALLPAGTNSNLSTEKFGIGPTAVLLAQPGNWTVGMLVNQIWSVSGANDREDISQAYLQPFANYNLPGGVSLGASMEATANWRADEQTWTAPLLFSVSKVAVLGKRPVNFAFAAGPVIAGPEHGADWRFRFAMVFLFPR